MAPAFAYKPALTLAQYAERARETDRFVDDPRVLERLRFGYFGEIGGLLAAVKKVARDQLHTTETEAAGEELGDALWYLVAMTNALRISPDDLGHSCLNQLRVHYNEKPITQHQNGITFRQIDGLLNAHQGGDESRRAAMLGDLAYAAGTLAQETSEQLKLQAAPSQTEHFGKLLADLARTCACFRLHIEDVALDNIEKITGRWPGSNPRYIALFDDDPKLPEYERLPRQFKILFEERDREKGNVVQSIRGVFVGDRLTDNSNEPDDYRFHDVFHLAYVAHLGWSPVVRGLLKRKRKSDAKKDENEDGARAMIIEEGIATWIFNHAKRREHYKDVKLGKLDFGLLKQIKSMVTGYEVENCPLWQWERAILDGFQVFRQLQKARQGTVAVDMNAHTLTFEP